MSEDLIKLAHGSGGVLTRRLLDETILRHFTSEHLVSLPDSAALEAGELKLAFTTDSYVVDPVFFPGGDIGKLAVFGTVNDLAVAGAMPRFLSCGLILEEGLPTSQLERVLASMQAAADTAGVEIVTGDTKVVPRGKADKIFVNTAGVGLLPVNSGVPAGHAEPGDAIIVTGPLGDHGAAVLSCREGIHLDSPVVSDCAPLTSAAQLVLGTAERVAFMRDLTRGGLATILNEIVEPLDLGALLDEDAVPVREEVRSICEMLGLDPLYLACEGRLVAVVDAGSADDVLDELHAVPGSEGSARIGTATEDYAGRVVMDTALGSRRLVQVLSGEQLPRIC
jgi:hydrogenase expression/formation protein HypE